MLKVDNLVVEVDNKEILKGIDFELKDNEIGVIFGQNGSGKSTFIQTLMGFSDYKVKNGQIFFENQNITNESIDKRAKLGMGIMLQKPPVIKGVKLIDVLKLLNSNEKEILNLAKKYNMESYLYREINKGFSGGEIKRSELFSLIIQSPKLALIDEPESGVDVDNLKLIGEMIKNLIQNRSGIVITHTGEILKYLPDNSKGFIFENGKVIKKGLAKELFKDIKKFGFRRGDES